MSPRRKLGTRLGVEKARIRDRQLNLVIGNKYYTHSFVVGAFLVKKDGITGLDLLRVLGARIDIVAEEIDLEGPYQVIRKSPI
jgi:hypothetical protein